MRYFNRKIRDLRHYLLCYVLTAGLFLALPSSIFAAPGDLDPTFGTGGIVITRGANLDAAVGMAIQSDGKIVVVGDGATGNTWDFAVVRYNTDGSLDTSFGGTGIVLTPVGISHDQAYSVVIQADGKIVVAGGSYNGTGGGSGSSFAVVRYNTNGSLDTSFNRTGIVITSVSGSFGRANSVAIQADGKIVAAGSRGSADFALVRYLNDGKLDTSFNGSGIVLTPVGGGANSVAIQADGKIVAVGHNQMIAVVRYNTDGKLDTSFNGTGIVLTPGGSANSVAIQSDGKIVVAASSGHYPSSDFVLVRYDPNGSLDTSFGGTGRIIIPMPYSASHARSVAIQSDGKIVAVGYTRSGNLVSSDYVVVRLNRNGTLDTAFNGTGIVITPFCCQSYAHAVAIQTDGKIVVAGGTDDQLFDFFDFVVIRYEGSSNSSARTRFDFDGDGRSDISVFRPSDTVWYLDKSQEGFFATQFGVATDKITPADFDGDRKTDIGVYRDGTWYWLASSDGSFKVYEFGLADDLPLPADFNGDGKAELAVYRNGTWWTIDLSNHQVRAVQFGLSTDQPVLADYDGDGKTDLAVFRPSTGYWYINRSSDNSVIYYSFGLNGDIPVTGDFNGDGRADLAVFRPSNGTWYIARPTGTPAQNFDAIQFGISTDVPAPADYDGDGRTDVAVFRNGVWYLLQSTSGIAIRQFGQVNDTPVPAAYSP
ncbi:MAG: FG-GAP-like repeat-containing protein [Pyrinomonadaceae bacterium]